MNEAVSIGLPVNSDGSSQGKVPPHLEINVGEEHPPLLLALAFLTRYYKRPYSPAVLKAGLPETKKGFDHKLFVRAAKGVRLNARVVRRGLKELSPFLLPAVLILEEKGACVLLGYTESGDLEVVLTETGEGVQQISRSELEALYTGYAILVRPAYRFGSEQERIEIDKGKSWFWGTLAKSAGIYSQVIIASVMINLFVLASPLYIMNVYDRVIPNNATETLWVLAGGVTMVYLFEFLIKTLRGYFIEMAGKKADIILANRIFDQVLNIRLGDNKLSSGAFANELREFASLREFFSSATLITLIDIPFALIFIGVVWLLCGPLAYVPLFTIPLMLIGVLLVQIPLRNVVKKSVVEDKIKHGILIETVTGLETIKSVRASGRMRQLWENSVGITSKYGQTTSLLSQLAVNYTAMIIQLSTVILVIYGSLRTIEGEITMGVMFAAVILNGRILAPLSQLAGILVRVDRSMSALRGLDRVMKQPVERSDEADFLHRPKLKGAIEFRDVSFAYPGEESAVLNNLSFTINEGERVAILGKVGSGKSTITKLLLNLYSVSEGSILVDGTDIRQIDPVDLRRNIGCVPQDIFLFMGSVRENISVGSPHAQDEEVLRAARLAGVDDFIRQDPKGYDKNVGERGQGLSGGQRQAVALARALLHAPGMLIFDEPTNSMDQQGEELLKQRLERLVSHRTLVLVTHRYSVLTLVNRIIVLDGGRVVADGPKDEVLAALGSGKVVIPKKE